MNQTHGVYSCRSNPCVLYLPISSPALSSALPALSVLSFLFVVLTESLTESVSIRPFDLYFLLNSSLSCLQWVLDNYNPYI